MDKKDQINIIISGIGGQGVFSLTKVIWNLCAKNNLKCQGATFKGGAQKAGSIHSEIRIFLDKNINHEYYSNQVRKGTLDLIIGLEPWETLRYSDFFNINTNVLMNIAEEPLYIERLMKEKFYDPVKEIEKFITNMTASDFTKEAKTKFNDVRMVNYLMLLTAINIGYLPFKEKLTASEFLSIIKLNN